MNEFYADPNVGGDGSRTTDDDNPTTGLANGGFWTRLVPMFTNVVKVANYVRNTLVTAAATSADAAAASAVTALNAPGTQATSSTAMTVGTGSKSCVIQLNKAIVPGMSVKVANAAAPTNWMHGDVTGYNPLTGALDFTSGTYAGPQSNASSWIISLSAPIPNFSGPLSVFVSGYTAVNADSGTLRYQGTSDATLNLTSATTLGAGWAVKVHNTSKRGVVTVDPAGAQTIDGGATVAVRPGEIIEIFCNGVSFDVVYLEQVATASTSRALSADDALTEVSSRRQSLSASVANVSLKLPDATKLYMSQQAFYLDNTGTLPIAIRDYSGNLLFNMLPGATATVSLKDNSIADGSWGVTGTGILYHRVVMQETSLAINTAPIASNNAYVKLSETLIVFIGCNGSTLWLQALDLTTNTLGTAVSVVISASTTFHASFKTGANSGVFVTFTGGSYNSVMFSVSGTTITPSAVSTLATTVAPLVQPNFGRGYNLHACIAQTSPNVLILPVFYASSGYTSCAVVAMTIDTSAQTAAYSSPLNFASYRQTTGSITVHSLFAVSATQAVITASDTTGNFHYRILMSISGTVISPQYYVADNLAAGDARHRGAPIKMTDDEWWDTIYNDFSTVVQFVRYKVSGATLNMTRTPLTLPGSAYNQIYNGDGLGPGSDGARIFAKLDDSTCTYTCWRFTGYSFFHAKLTWNGTAFVLSTLSSQPNTDSITSQYPSIAGPNTGVYALVCKGTSTGGLNVFNLDAPEADGTPRMYQSYPVLQYSEDVHGTQAFQFLYRGNKLFVVSLCHSTQVGNVNYAMASEVLCVDTKSGALLSRGKLRQSAKSPSNAYRALMMKDGALAVSIDNTTVTVLELAK